MRIELEPEVLAAPVGSGVLSHAQMRDAAEAMFNSTEFIETFGTPQGANGYTNATARKVLLDEQPISTVQNSATAVHLRALLSEYDIQIVKTAAQIRSFVTNSLIEEAAPGNKNRIRALELLGKISEVGLFTERTEVTVKHQTTIELEQKVRDKIAALISKKSSAQDVDARDTSPETITDRMDELTDILITPPKNATS
jgi:Xaa-Pro aminopeptidase